MSGNKLGNCAGSIEYAEYVDIIDITEVIMSEFKGGFNHGNACVLKRSRLNRAKGRPEE